MRDIGVGVCLLVVKGNTILVAERIGDSGKGFLAVPGGKQERGESWGQAALRELAEEAGSVIKVNIRPFTVPNVRTDSNVPIFVTNNVLTGGSHWVTVWLCSEWLAGDPLNLEPMKKKGWTWMTLGAIVDDERMRGGKEAWMKGDCHDALHWMPLHELHRYRNKIGI